jgi:hypothetical protein
MKAMLFKLLSAADRVVVDGYEIEEQKWFQGEEAIRLICDEDNEWTVKDQEVDVNNDGSAEIVGRRAHEGEDDTLTVEFFCEVALPFVYTSSEMK